jgi:hypothetical protein
MLIHQLHQGTYSNTWHCVANKLSSFCCWHYFPVKVNTLRNGCVSFPFPHEDIKSSSNTTPSLSHLTPSTNTKSNAHLINSHSLQGELKFHIRYLTNIFICLGCSKENVGPCSKRSMTFRYMLVPFRELTAPSPNPSLDNHALTALGDSLFNAVPATLHTLRSQTSSAN